MSSIDLSRFNFSGGENSAPIEDLTRLPQEDQQRLVLAGIDYVIVWAMYEASKRSWDSYRTWPGALLSTAAMVVVSIVFSVFISASVKYPLVYGSLASVILLMLWLYTVCTVILCGAAFNIVIRDLKARDTY